MVLVGTKLDLREDEEAVKKLAEKGVHPVTTEQGTQLCKDIGAARYLECSSLTQKNLKNVFDEAIKVILYPKQQKKKKGCTIL